MAQLGARFHGMEEVVSSNLTRSTNNHQIFEERMAAEFEMDVTLRHTA